MTNDTLPLATRTWFAWLCFFRVLFDARFAARLWSVRDAPQLPPRSGPDTAVSAAGPVASASFVPSQPSEPPPVTAALQLLALFQREGRLVDFLQQEITSFSDADVGVAARVVHEGCRKALRTHAVLEPVRTEAEGSRITVAGGFHVDEIKLVGDVKGQPPYTGVLRHRGWRATKVTLPQIVGEHDAHVLAPAELELG